MKINGLATLSDYIRQHPKTKKWIENWISDSRSASWKTPHDIKNRYASASFLADNIIIFNVCGNDFRLEVLVAYKNEVVLVRWIGTHAEYTRRNKS